MVIRSVCNCDVDEVSISFIMLFRLDNIILISISNSLRLASSSANLLFNWLISCKYLSESKNVNIYVSENCNNYRYLSESVCNCLYLFSYLFNSTCSSFSCFEVSSCWVIDTRDDSVAVVGLVVTISFL